jgi:hypothetical protein
MCRVSAINGERVSNQEARARAAKPQHSGGDLLRPAEAADRLFFRDVSAEPETISINQEDLRVSRDSGKKSTTRK